MARALIIVDYQNDFARPDGALSVPGGEEIAGASTRSPPRATTTSCSPRATGTRPTTARSPRRAAPGRLHCVQGTEGAELHPELDTRPDRRDRRQGPGPGHGRLLGASTRPGSRSGCATRGVDELTIVGLATDYCVKNTALDALREGFAVRVDPRGVRGVEVEPGDSERALEELRAAGATVA